MKLTRVSRLAAGFAVGLAAATAALPAASQTYPASPVRIIVPFPAGASLDTVVRVVARKMTESWGQNVFVENKTGAGGIIGIGAGAQAAPDGYTFTAVANSFAGNTVLRKDLPYDAFKDFEPVTLLGAVPHVLVARKGLPAEDLKALVAHAKANPGKVSYASGGIGTSSHLGAEMFARAAGVELTHVPYRGQGPALLDVVAGQVDLTLGNMPEVIPHVKSGAIRALAIVAPERSSLEPNWPTMDEMGYKGVVSDSWYGIVAPAGTPKDVVAAFQREAAKALAQPDVKAQLDPQGFVASGNSPEAFRDFLRDTAATYKKVIDAAGIKVE
jgi:tripartite-type tricarboxylate transporter receptor subunit TctC